MEKMNLLPGKPLPSGATVFAGGVNFSVFSRHGTSVILELFEAPDDAAPSASFVLDSRVNRTGDIWHVFVEGLSAGALYLYRVDGPFRPFEGLRFNVNEYLLDPYAKALTQQSVFQGLEKRSSHPHHSDPDLAYSTRHSAEHFPKCVVVDDDDFDWEGDRPLNYALRKSVLYEAHVRGLTVHPSSPVEHPGTYRGVIESIPYLKGLGITGIELLPVQEFDEWENARANPETGERLKNYWGYSTIAFFSPKSSFSSDRVGDGPVREFKEMVKALHRAGIEVILDIVFNHTAEGNERGVTMCFRGFDNPVYYMLEDNRRYYRNYSGCGNTVNCNHPVVRTFILDCLRYWVTEMHVDGFRFDLGSILGRDQKGNLLENPPMIERIAEDPVLRDTKIIAEAWDAGGAYQVGWFPGGRWAEWNDRFRDDVRAFWRGDDGLVSHLATRVTGSSDLYLRDGRKPFHSINFLTSHDGFTLNDLVSYNGKHNEANGEDNRDGGNHNVSYNYGMEGPSPNASIERVRDRQIKNLFLTMLVSLGTPMILMGDEVRRTQQGNNNAYCQDNDLSWLDWSRMDAHADILRFVSELIAFRKRHQTFLRPEFLTGAQLSSHTMPDVSWFGPDGKGANWGRLDKFIAYRLLGSRATVARDCDENDFCVMFNASVSDLTVTLCPPPPGKTWERVIDTSVPSPRDILPPGSEEKLQNQSKYRVAGRSGVVLISKMV